ncbi:isochorismate synthase [Salinibacterium hongtaonis]|uniref:isochorismate synthase n=1 Tax=Homoserinimonas hongtaonis TaxID=2079791 RepID=UPI0018F013AB|nr:isochorismate synthase [Salinibacterium hongtaonis]
MTEAAPQIPALTVETSPIADPGPLAAHLDRDRPLLWRRRGFGIRGHGEAVRLEFSGEHRMTDAAAAWKQLVAAATITDPLRVPGTGLVAFGTFTFAADSAQTSVLIVPSVVVGRAEGRFWLTRIRQSTDASTGTGTDGPFAADLPATEPLGTRPHVALTPGSLSPEGYTTIVGEGVRRIRDGLLSKVVLARDLTGRLDDGGDIRTTIATLADGYPDCWTFAVDGFFGASPETLVGVHSGTVTARVLAGSAARGTDAASDLDAATALATSTKDQDEHEFAVQSVLSSLRPHSRGVVASETPFTLKLPNLWHLASDVEGLLDDGATSLDLIQSLHPTAAVAGTPTPDAVRLLGELEPFDRERYAGPVGWVDADGDGEWAVALRSAQLDADGTVTAWAGAGIVADSVPEQELVETRMKFRPIADAFDPAE